MQWSLYLSAFCLFTGVGLLIIVLGVPVYWLGVCWEQKPQAFQKFMISLTHGVQKLLVCVPEEEEKDE